MNFDSTSTFEMQYWTGIALQSRFQQTCEKMKDFINTKTSDRKQHKYKTEIIAACCACIL